MEVEASANSAASAQTGKKLSAGCPMSELLEVLTRPWTMHILWLLGANGPMRFGALRRSVEGISARLLTLRLRTLERRGFVQRTVRQFGNGRTPEVTYSPTTRLGEMNEIMAQLGRLSGKWQAEDSAAANLSPEAWRLEG